jgi:hypothetical protein
MKVKQGWVGVPPSPWLFTQEEGVVPTCASWATSACWPFHYNSPLSLVQRHHVGIAASKDAHASAPVDSELFAILDSSLVLMFVYCYLYMEGSCEAVEQEVRDSYPCPWRNWNAMKYHKHRTFRIKEQTQWTQQGDERGRWRKLRNKDLPKWHPSKLSWRVQIKESEWSGDVDVEKTKISHEKCGRSIWKEIIIYNLKSE